MTEGATLYDLTSLFKIPLKEIFTLNCGVFNAGPYKGKTFVKKIPSTELPFKSLCNYC